MLKRWNAGINLLLLLVLSSGISSQVFSQSFEVLTGPNFNSLYSSGKDAAYYTPYSSSLGEGEEKLSSNWYFGFQARITYNIPVEKTLVLAPYYPFYLGLTDEFNDLIGATKSMRHYLGLVFKIPLQHSSAN